MFLNRWILKIFGHAVRLYFSKSIQVEKATSEMALDPKTRLLIFKMINNAVLEAVNGIVSSGKEAVVFHAQGGE